MDRRPGAIPEHHVSKPTAHRTLGKLIVLLLSGGAAGYFYHLDVLSRSLRAAALPAERAPDCPLVSGALVAHIWPLWGDMTLLVVMALAFFGLYEFLGAGVGRLVGVLLRFGPRSQWANQG